MGDKCNQMCKHNQGDGTCQYEKHETWYNFGTKACADDIDMESEGVRQYKHYGFYGSYRSR